MNTLNTFARDSIVAENELKTGNDDFLIDVHGLTVNEALEYTRERVAKWHLGSSRTKLKRYPPFQIVTGIGSHSTNRDPVLSQEFEESC